MQKNITNLADIIALLLSGISIVVAIIAFIKSQQMQNKMLEIEKAREKDRQIEKQKANITARLQHLQKSGRYELIIENNGVSEARDINVTLNGKLLSDFNDIQPSITNSTTIGPQSNVSYHWKTGHPNIPPFNLEITWSDDSKQTGIYHTTLSHPTTPK